MAGNNINGGNGGYTPPLNTAPKTDKSVDQVIHSKVSEQKYVTARQEQVRDASQQQVREQVQAAINTDRADDLGGKTPESTQRAQENPAQAKAQAKQDAKTQAKPFLLKKNGVGSKYTNGGKGGQKTKKTGQPQPLVNSKLSKAGAAVANGVYASAFEGKDVEQQPIRFPATDKKGNLVPEDKRSPQTKPRDPRNPVLNPKVPQPDYQALMKAVAESKAKAGKGPQMQAGNPMAQFAALRSKTPGQPSQADGFSAGAQNNNKVSVMPKRSGGPQASSSSGSSGSQVSQMPSRSGLAGTASKQNNGSLLDAVA